MSQGTACKCPDKQPGHRHFEDRRIVEWEVLQRKSNNSAFNGYHFTQSDYSSVHCTICGAVWRTKAGYVADLIDAPRDPEPREHDGRNAQDMTPVTSAD